MHALVRPNRALVVCMLAFTPVLASAQICRGSADVSTTQRLQAGASATFAEVGNGIYGVAAGGSNAYVLAGRAGVEDWIDRIETNPELTNAFHLAFTIAIGR